MTQNEFIEAVRERLDHGRRDEASKRTIVVLTTFSEILYRTERDTLGAHSITSSTRANRKIRVAR